MRPRVCLAATCHDPSGGFAAGIAGASALWGAVDHVVVNATVETHPDVLRSLTTGPVAAGVATHAAGSVGIGRARRDALEMALSTDCTHVLYSDLDHVLRWARVDPDELGRALVPDPEVDLVVIGRTSAAFAAEPERLQHTESSVNRAVSLALGTQEVWDFLMAIRLMTVAAAQDLVAHCPEDSIGNDVAWPLHLRRTGARLAYRGVGGLAYRHRDDFGRDRDDRDLDPLEWVRRIEIAALHARAARPYL